MNQPKSRLITAASTIFWVWGVLLVISGIAIGYPAFATEGAVGPIFIMVAWGIAYCVGGFALRRRQWGVRWWASALCAISVLVLLFVQVKMSLLGIALNIAALVLIAGSWRALVLAPAPNPQFERDALKRAPQLER